MKKISKCRKMEGASRAGSALVKSAFDREILPGLRLGDATRPDLIVAEAVNMLEAKNAFTIAELLAEVRRRQKRGETVTEALCDQAVARAEKRAAQRVEESRSSGRDSR